MKDLKPRYCGLVIGLLLMCSPSAFGKNSITLSLQSDIYTDDDSPETKGVEMAVPFQLTYEHDPFDVMLRAAYADAKVSRDGSADMTLSGVTDTFISASYTYPFATRNPTKALMKLDLNLPTGKETLNAEQVIAESELRGDLFRVDDFGEGLNVGVTMGLERQIGGNMFGLYGGFTYYGSYDPRSDESDDEYDPGDEIFAGALYERKGGARYTLQAYLGYSYFDVDAVNDADALKIGDKLSAGADLQASLLGNLDMAFALQYIFQFKSEDAFDGKLVKEPTNSNGDELFTSLDLTYRCRPSLSVLLMSELRYYGESDRMREDLALPFEGRRLRYAIGSGLKYHVTPAIAVHGMGSYFHLERDPSLNSTVHREFQGMNLDIGMTYAF